MRVRTIETRHQQMRIEMDGLRKMNERGGTFCPKLEPIMQSGSAEAEVLMCKMLKEASAVTER